MKGFACKDSKSIKNHLSEPEMVGIDAEKAFQRRISYSVMKEVVC